MAQLISITEAKQRLTDLARRNRDHGETFVLLRDSEPISALVPFDEYESMIETLDILEQHPTIGSDLAKARAEIAKGNFETLTAGKSRRQAPKRSSSQAATRPRKAVGSDR